MSNSEYRQSCLSRERESPGFIRGRSQMNLIGVGQAVDVIVVSPEEIEEYRDSHSLVISPALDEGQEVYRATREAASS
jgi:hypothetical protein